MKKKYIILLCGICAVLNLHAQITIAEARSMSLGSVVTVKGIALNGAELGDVRYLQDATGSISSYAASLLDDVNRGDSVLVTGTLANYNALLEIDATSATIVNSGNPLPAPVVVTCASGFAESYEARLVQVDEATFSDSGTFSSAGSGTNYDINDATGMGQVRVNTSTNIDGTPIPADAVNVTGIMSQYAPSGSGGYQLLPRDLSDISTGGNPPVISTPLTQTNITTSSFTVNFSTVNPGNTVLYYGTTETLGSVVSDGAMTLTHAFDLTGLTSGTVYYIKAASVSATNDTSYSAVTAMATESNSSGTIKVWFNNPVDNSVSTGVDAVYCNGTFADSIIYFMDHAKYSLDICIYNIDNDNNIITAINEAYARGVTVRVICDNGVSATNYNLINVGAGNKVKSPVDGSTNTYGQFYGIDHNKFMIVDAVSFDPDDPWVVTGSTNYTDEQVNTDRNNLIAIQDESLAKTYEIEFNEMFGGSFGPDKRDNTPHQFIIGGKQVECYFSPSDNTENHLIDKINSADYDLYFAVYSYTRYGISYAIQDAVEDRGVFAAGIYDQTDPSDSTAIQVLEETLGPQFFHYSGSGLLHHKYLIVDPNCPHSDPLVWTGSHNWTSSANSRNDENSIVVHDSTIANIYYQEFVQRYKDEGGTIFVSGRCNFTPVVNTPPGSASLRIYPNPANNWMVLSFQAAASGGGKLEVVDKLGRVLLSEGIKWAEGKNTWTIPLSDTPSGLYYCIMSSGDMQIDQPVVVMH